MEFFLEYLPLFMFAVMAVLLFTGFPVAFVLGGVGIATAIIGILAGVLIPIQLYTITTRIWAGAAENLVLTTIPLFVFMGIMLERSGVAKDMLNSLQTVLGRVPGVGDHFEHKGLRFEVMDMDDNRVDRILVQRAKPTP